MRYGVRTAVTGALLAGTAAGCSNHYPTNFIKSSDKQLVTDTVHQTGVFWGKHGIPLGDTLKSVVVVGDETFRCGSQTLTSDAGNALYCGGSNTLAIPVAGLNEVRVEFKEDAEASMRTWLREAVGGLVQAADPSLTQNAPAEHHDLYLHEERACLAGIATYNLQPGDTTAAFQLYLHTGDSRTEGHWLARGYAHGFEATTTDRAVCADVPISTD